MQPVIMSELLQNREEAGYLLSKKLAPYRNSDSVVIGIPPGGISVASVIAENLSLPLDVMPCRKIKHPADGKRNIGSVSENDVFIYDYSHAIPQDYVYHQITLLRNVIVHESKNYRGSYKPIALRYRTVILVDDFLSASDTMMACLRSIRKQSPLKVVVAIPVVSAEAARVIGAEADDIQFLRIEPSLLPPQEYFADFPKVDEQQVKVLLEISRKNK